MGHSVICKSVNERHRLHRVTHSAAGYGACAPTRCRVRRAGIWLGWAGTARSASGYAEKTNDEHTQRRGGHGVGKPAQLPVAPQQRVKIAASLAADQCDLILIAGASIPRSSKMARATRFVRVGLHRSLLSFVPIMFFYSQDQVKNFIGTLRDHQDGT
ncbi:MAG: hypothetical protein AAGD12_15705 [Pseudomonadota bacterium]